MTRHYCHESAEAIESAINALPDVVNGGGMITVQSEPAAAEIAPGASVEDTSAAIRDRYTPAEIRALIALLKPARG